MSLSTLCIKVADVARRRDSGMLATPDSFRPNQSPLGAVLLPQALTTVGTFPSPERLSLARAGSAFSDAKSVPGGSLLSSLRNPQL